MEKSARFYLTGWLPRETYAIENRDIEKSLSSSRWSHIFLKM